MGATAFSPLQAMGRGHSNSHQPCVHRYMIRWQCELDCSHRRWSLHVRELLHLAMVLVYVGVILQYRVLPQLCAGLQQHGTDSRPSAAYFGSNQRALLCGSGACSQQPAPNAGEAPTAITFLKAVALRLWVQLVAVGDLAVAAHAILAVMLAVCMLQPACTNPCLHTFHNLLARFLSTAGSIGVFLSPANARYHMLEAALSHGQRLPLFASLGWLGGWLYPVPLTWQLPVGLLEHLVLWVTCSRYDALAGRPPPTVTEQLLGFAVAWVLPTAFNWHRSRAASHGSSVAAGARAVSNVVQDKVFSHGKLATQGSCSQPPGDGGSSSSSWRTWSGGSLADTDKTATAAAAVSRGCAAQQQLVPGNMAAEATPFGPAQDESAARARAAAVVSLAGGAAGLGGGAEVAAAIKAGGVARLGGGATAATAGAQLTRPAAQQRLFTYTPVTQLLAFTIKVPKADFAASAAAARVAVQQGLSDVGQKLLATHMGAVPGCVLLLGQLAAPAEPLQDTQGSAQGCSHCVPASDGGAWAVVLPPPRSRGPPAAAGTPQVQGQSVGVWYDKVQQLQSAADGGQLAAAISAVHGACSVPTELHAPAPGSKLLAAAVERSSVSSDPDVALAASRDQVMEGTPAAPLLPVPAAAGCHHSFCAVGCWGSPVQLHLHLPPGSLLPSQHGGTSTSTDVPAYGAVRVVLTQGFQVLLDQRLPLAGAAAVAADGSAKVLLQLQPPADSTFGSATAAAVCLTIFLDGAAPAAGAAGTIRRLPAPPVPTQVNLLMMEQSPAAELLGHVTRHQMTAHELSGLLGDMAFLVATQQQLQEATGVNAEPVGQGLRAAAAALAAVSLAVEAADGLCPYLLEAGLPLAADLVAAVKQQVLLGAARLQPPAAGTVGPQRQTPSATETAAAAGAIGPTGPPAEGAAAAAGGGVTEIAAAATRGAAAEPPVGQVVDTALPVAGAATPAGGGEGSQCSIQSAAWQACLVRQAAQHSLLPATSAPAALPRQQHQHPGPADGTHGDGGDPGSSAAASSAWKDPAAAATPPASYSGKATAPAPNKGPSAATPCQLPITQAERQAMACGGWPRALLCWNGFSSCDTEHAYQLFKSDHLWVWDWICGVYSVVVGLQLLVRYVKAAEEGLGLHRAYGMYWLLEWVARLLMMMLARPAWRRWRRKWLLLSSARSGLKLAVEPWVWSQAFLASGIGSNANKVALFVPVGLLMHIAPPQDMTWMWFVVNAPCVGLTLVRATSDAIGFGGWVHHLRCTGGTPMLLYCLGYTLATFGLMLCMGLVTDTWGRRAFLRAGQQQDQRWHLLLESGKKV